MNRARILVIDLETSGLDAYAGCILEVGAVLLDEHLFPAGKFEAFPEAPTDVPVPALVQEMHERSGLWAARDAVNTPPVEQVEADLIGWLCGHGVDAEPNAVVLAGSGVAAFDLPWLRVHMPRFARMCTYWCYDVSPVRRMAELAGRADLVMVAETETKMHRALDDAMLHAREVRAYVEMLQARPRRR